MSDVHGRRPAPEMPADIAYSAPALDVYVAPGPDSIATNTAVLLTGTADEFGIPQSEIRSDSRGGYWISDRLADIVYDEPAEDEIPQTPDPAPAEPVKKKKGTNS